MSDPDDPDRRHDEEPPRRYSDRVRDFFESLMLPIVVAIVVLLIINAAVSVGVLKQQARITAQQERSTRAIGGSCERLQIARDDLNENAWTDRGNSLTSADEANAVASVLERFSSQSAELRSLAGPFRTSAKAFQGRARRAKYLPPTDCSLAVRHPGSYRPPTPIRFSEVAACYEPDLNPRPEAPCPKP